MPASASRYSLPCCPRASAAAVRERDRQPAVGVHQVRHGALRAKAERKTRRWNAGSRVCTIIGNGVTGMGQACAAIGEFDVVIIGAGTAGCLLANRLSRGSAVPRRCCSRPAATTTTCGSASRSATSTASAIRAPTGALSPSPKRAERPVDPLSARQGAGRLLAINGMIYMRGQRAATMTAGATATAMAPIQAGAGMTCCLTSCGTRISTPAPTPCTAPAASGGSRSRACGGTILDAFRAAAAEQGIPAATTTSTAADNFGCGYFDVNQRRGVRWNTAKAFLRPVQASAEPDGV